MKKRCAWVKPGSFCTEYHDREWGVPLRDDGKLFEFLILDGFQAGLSWETILRKRPNFRKAFDSFDPEKIAMYGEKERRRLMEDPGIIRNRLKIAAAVTNARAFLDVQGEFKSFADYIWRFSGGRPIQNAWRDPEDIPVATAESEAMSRDLKKRGFRFVGPTICYAFMQAAGLVNDHTTDCFRHAEITMIG